MAGLAASEIRVGANGTIYVAPDGTAGPVDVNAAWPAAFVNVGYASDDGVTLNRSMETDTITPWQTISPLRYLITGITLTAAFSLLQWNKDTVALYFGGGAVVNQGGGSFRYDISSAPSIDERVLGVEWTDGALKYRFVIPRGMITETGESNVTRSAGIALPITFSAMTPDAGTVLGYLVTNDTSWA